MIQREKENSSMHGKSLFVKEKKNRNNMKKKGTKEEKKEEGRC